MAFFKNLKRAFGFNDNGEDLDDEIDYDLSRSPFANPFKRDQQPRNDLYLQQPDETEFVEQTVVDRPSAPVAQPEQQPQPLPDVETPAQQPRQQPQPAENPQPEAPAVQVAQVDTAAPVAQQPADNPIIDVVVQLINASLPPMMKQYIDTEGQRRDVAQALAPHLAGTQSQQGDAQLKILLKQSDMQRRAAQNRANDLSLRITELENENDRLEIERKSLLNKIKVLQVSTGNNNEMAKADSESAARIEQLQQQVAQLSTEANSAQQTIDQLNAQLERSSAALADKETAIVALHQQLNDANEELKLAEQLEQRVEEMEQFRTSKTEEMRNLRQRIAQLEKENQEVDHIKAASQLASEENIKIKKELETLNRSIRETRDKHNRRDVELANRINDLKAQVAAAATLAESYKDNLDEQIKTNDKLRADIEKHVADGKKRDKDNLKNMKQLTAERDNLRQELDAARVVSDNITQQLQEAKQQLEDAKKQQHDSIEEVSSMTQEQPSAYVPAPVHENEDASSSQEPVEVAVQEPVDTPQPSDVVVSTDSSQAPAAQESDEPAAADKGLGITLDDIDDVDWLIPVEPDPIPEPAPEPEPEPAPEPKPKTDPRQLSLW